MPTKQTPKPAKAPDSSKSSKDLDIDVDDALIDDQHPKDTIQGGPAAAADVSQTPKHKK